MAPHDAWQLLFFNPFFWEQTGKKGLELRRVCRGFRSDIPERLAIEAAFRRILIRKVDVYRLFPLSINHVLQLRSPLLFMDAFRLAERKTGGFEFCLAVVRDKGWALRTSSAGVQRDRHRAKLLADLHGSGVLLSEPSDLFEAAVSGRRRVESAVVWRFVAFIYHTGADGRLLGEETTAVQYDDLLHRIRNAVGFWYKGIHRDVCSVCDGIARARRSYAMGRPIGRMHHQHIAAGKFVVGVVEFRPWYGL